MAGGSRLQDGQSKLSCLPDKDGSLFPQKPKFPSGGERRTLWILSNSIRGPAGISSQPDNIYTADIIKVDGVSYAFFADDTGYFVTHRDPKVITQKLQEAQQCLEHFQKRWKIKVNAAKTQAVYFTRNRSLRLLPDVCIEVNGHHVPWDTEAKYLGLLMDSKLKFDKHINMSLTKCDKLTRSLYALVKRQSRLQLHNKLLLFKGVFRAVLSYGSPAWMTCAATHRRRLQLKQNKLLKMILNRAPWYRTEDLHVEANMETVDQFINRIWEKFRASCQLSINPLIEGILND